MTVSKNVLLSGLVAGLPRFGQGPLPALAATRIYVTGITQRIGFDTRRSRMDLLQGTRGATMTSALAAQRPAEARKLKPGTVTLPCCSDEEYAQRIAKSDEVKGYVVPGYLTA